MLLRPDRAAKLPYPPSTHRALQQLPASAVLFLPPRAPTPQPLPSTIRPMCWEQDNRVLSSFAKLSDVSANYSLWAACSPPCVSVNKVLLDCSHILHSETSIWAFPQSVLLLVSIVKNDVFLFGIRSKCPLKTPNHLPGGSLPSTLSFQCVGAPFCQHFWFLSKSP